MKIDYIKTIAKYLRRPLVVLDTETTGTDKQRDEIITISATKIWPNYKTETLSIKVKPSFPIPVESSEVHGIYDKDVASCPSFATKAFDISTFIKNCDLAGYNVDFDLSILTRQLEEAGIKGTTINAAIYDAFAVFKDDSPRDLKAAVRYYTDREIEDAHDADGDVKSTISVIAEQLIMRKKPLHEVAEEFAGKTKDRYIVVKDGREYLNFGKNKGQALDEVDPGFLKWMLNKDFPSDVKATISKYV